MSGTIKIRDFGSVIQYADLEDLPEGAATELKNMRVVHGKLVKVSEMGALLDEVLDTYAKTPTALFTWIHSRLSASSAPVGSGSGFLHLIAIVNDSTKKLQIYTWNGTTTAWVAIDTVASGIDFTTASYYQTLGTDTPSKKLPVIQSNEILRFLPGYTAKPDGTNVAVGAWIGWIGRDYFDGLFLASAYTAKFFSYAREISKPTFTPTIAQHDADGAFSPADPGIPITALSEAYNLVSVAGAYPAQFVPGKLFEILGNTTNYGTYRVLSSLVASDQTSIVIDTTYKDFLGSESGGFVKITTERESRWYKFSYVYDGNQESLLSEARKVDFGDQKFPSFSASFLKADHNKRITAIKVYRSANGQAGTYYHIHTIDFLRKTGQYGSGASGAYSGERAIYIPGMDTQSSGQTPTAAGKIKLWNNNTQTYVEYTTSSYLTSTSRVLFVVTADVDEDDYWDCTWQYAANGTDYTITGDSGAFAGQKVMVVGDDLGELNYSGGVLVATGTRMVDASSNRAVHLTSPIVLGGDALSDGAWKLFSTEKGLFFYSQSGEGNITINWSFWDTALPDGALHPFEAETSIVVNGAYARMIAGRLFQAKICLDPADKAEQHEDWASYSEPNQPDVCPVSNVLRFADREGGPLTGVEELFGWAVFTKEQGLIGVNCKSSPATPTLWTTTESIHDIGNVAPLGMVKAGDELYVPSWNGIYRVRVNNLSASDATPTEKLKITEPIDNVYNSMTNAQKRAMVGTYNHRRNECHWFFSYTDPDTLAAVKQHWAYNVITGAWRELYVYYSPLATGFDEAGNAIALEDLGNDTAQVVAVETERDAADGRFLFRSKVFAISEDSPQPIRRIMVIYKSPHALKLRLYLDGSDTMTEDYDLPAQAEMKPYTVAVGYSCYRMQFVITDDTGAALVVEESDTTPVYLIVEQNALSPNVEIGGMNIVIG